MKNRILALLLAVIMVVGMLPAAALAAEENKPEFSGVNMTLNHELNVNFKVALNSAAVGDCTVEVKVGEATTETLTCSTDSVVSGIAIFVLKLAPHRMTEKVTATLKYKSNTVATEEFSVEDYVEKLKKNNAYLTAEEMWYLLDAMENFGKYATAFKSSEAADSNVVNRVTADDLKAYERVVHQKPVDGFEAAISLYLDNACDLVIRFTGFTDEHKLLINDEDVTALMKEQGSVYTIDGLLPQQWGEGQHIVVKDGNGTDAFNVEYSVLSYAYSKLKAGTTASDELQGMLKAMYLYYDGATSYIDHSVTENSDRMLYTNGTSNGYTLLFDGKNSTIKTAVDFFNGQLKAVTGVQLGYHGSYNGYNGTDDWSKEPTSWSETDKYIVFGNKADMPTLANITVPNNLGHDGFYIVTKGKSVFVYAENDEMYQLAVIELLDILVGYEMYSADCVTFTSDGKNISIPDMNITVTPDVDYRNRGNYLSVGGGTYGMGYTNNNIFMSVNGNMYHTALDLLDPSTYYGSHDDWFYLYSQNDKWWDQLLGNERYDHYQLCYSTIDDSDINTSGSALNIIYNNIKTVVNANPDLENLSLGPADNNYVCDCENCQAALATYGSNSGAYISVANKLAAKLREDYPDRTVNLVVFAYRQYDAAPTKDITVDQNVGVMVAPIEANWATALRDQETYANNIKAWAKLTDNMYFWFYQTNFDNYFYPLNSWGVMDDNIAFAHQNGAKYLFYQGAGDKNVSHFSKLKDYLESKLMLDSSLNKEELIKSFFNAYYGPAAEQMLRYFNALQTHMNGLTSTGGYKEEIGTEKNWPKAKLQEFMNYINAAKAEVAGNSVYAQRITLESLFPRYALLSLYNDATTAGIKAAFMNDCEELGITNFCEGKTLATELSSWKHEHAFDKENTDAKYLVSSATCGSPATYYYSCECGKVGEATFESGTATDNHTYTFTAGEGADEGYDIGTCTGNCGTTVKVKTDYTASAPVDIINGTAATLTMPDGFKGTVTGVKFGTQDVGYADGKINTTSIQQASHGLWKSIDVTFTSEYGGTHTAKVPVTLITDVIDTVDELKAFASTAMAANTGNQLLYGYYILGGDIDCKGASIASGNGAWNTSGFMGTLDGRGYKIQNLLVDNQGGIFGRMGKGSTVKDIHFENVEFEKNAALFGKVTYQSIFTNVTVDVASWVSVSDNMTYAGILGVTSNTGSTFTDVVINVADGVSVSNLLGREFTGATGDITVNLGAGSKIVNYYTTDSAGSNCVITLPSNSIITVNQKIAQTIDIETIIEGNTMPATGLSNGSVRVLLGGKPYSGTVAGGMLTIVDLPTATGKQTENVVITYENGDTYTYTNIWHVTQVIDTVDELKTLGARTATEVVTGYYILDADINCNNENMATHYSGQDFGFGGIFDGRDKTISNIVMKWEASDKGGYGGLFSNLLSATIKNVTFDKVQYSNNSALLGRYSFKPEGAASNTTIENIVVNVSAWTATDEAGVLVSRGTRNTVHNNVKINIADNLTVNNLLGKVWNGNFGSGITVNLGENSKITAYYWSGEAELTAVTTVPSIVTVNSTYTPKVETYQDLAAAEGTTSLTLSNPLFTKGNATVSINGGAESTVAITEEGKITLNLAGAAMGKLANGIVITTPKGDKLTYSEVWYVTQVIDNVTELKALGAACKAAVTGGYYILGADINCNNENMATHYSGQDFGFGGIFDGRGYTISNIKMAWESATNGGYGGLFGRLYGCTIKNVVFDGVNLGANGVLLGHMILESATSEVYLQDLTVNLSACGNSGSNYGLFAGYSMQKTHFTGVTVNVADNVTIHRLLARVWYSNDTNGNLTINLGTNSTITAYDQDLYVKPDFITVIGPDTLFAAEGGNTIVTLERNTFAVGDTASVTINEVTKAIKITEAGKLTVNLTEFGVSTMGQYPATVKVNDKTYTYNEVWYVTQVINDVNELKALGTSCKDEIVTGYYILGNDIDCGSTKNNMANGSNDKSTKGFAGTFDGRGLTISNIYMSWESAGGGVGGLFGMLLGATVQNTVFDNVQLSTNGTLLAAVMNKNADTNKNTTLSNLTVNLSQYNNSGYGVLASYSIFNTVTADKGLTINVADGLTVTKLLARENCNSIGYIHATVNLYGTSSITNYYGTTTTKPDTITVNQK